MFSFLYNKLITFLQAKDNGCYSEVGFQHGKQTLNLQKNEIDDGCFYKASIMHEFLHGKTLVLFIVLMDKH